MTFTFLRQITACTTLALASTVGISAHAASSISMEAASPNSIVGLLPQSMAPIWSKAGLNVQLALDQTLTKSLLKLSQGTLDAAVVPPSAYADLKAGKGPYAKMGDKGTQAAANVRALWGFSASNYHPLVWADSGITDWSQIKGKRVYIGPPASVGNTQITAIIKKGSGLDPETGYQPIKAPWGTASQGFQDGQYDVLFLPAALGSSVIAEISMVRPIRMLGLPSDANAPVELGLVNAVVPKGTYKTLVNQDQDILTWKTVMMVMVNKDVSDEVAYQLTKNYIESRETLAKGNALLKELPTDNPYDGVIAPLHPGAVMYYQQAGYKIPAELMPK